MTQKKTMISIRLDNTLLKHLDVWAKREGRSRTEIIESFCFHGLINYLDDECFDELDAQDLPSPEPQFDLTNMRHHLRYRGTKAVMEKLHQTAMAIPEFMQGKYSVSVSHSKLFHTLEVRTEADNSSTEAELASSNPSPKDSLFAVAQAAMQSDQANLRKALSAASGKKPKRARGKK